MGPHTPAGRCCCSSPLIVICMALALTGLISCSAPPASEVQWEALPGPYARNLSTVFPFASGPEILAGLTNGEIAFSSDGGKTWAYRTPAFKGDVIYHFTEVPERRSLIYAATGRGLFLTADTARSWQRVRLGDAGDTTFGVTAFASDPWKPNISYAGTRWHGLFRSTDNGTTWHSLHTEGDTLLRRATVWDLALDTGHPDRLVAAIGALGAATSTNAGYTWHVQSRGSAAVGAQTTHVLLHPQNGDLILLGNDAGSIYRSTNFGQHWSPVRPAAAGDRILSLGCQIGQPNTVFAGTESGVFVSNDFGESWQLWEGSPAPVSATLVLPAAPPRRIFAFGSATGLRVSTDQGASWQPADASLGGATASLLTMNARGDTTYAVVRNTVLRYSPGSSGWKPIGEGLSGGTVLSLAIDTRDPSCLYATSAIGAFRTTDGGMKWLPFARSLQSTPEILVPHPWFPTRLLASGTLGIFVSTDRGNTWKHSRPTGKTPQVRSFTFRETNAGIVFAAATPAAVVFTQDGGISWEMTRYGLGGDSLLFLSLDDQDLKVCYAWTATGGCYRSINNGLEWSRFSPPWNATDHVLFATDSRSATNFVALVNSRVVYLTASGGTTWTRVVDSRLPGDPVAAAWHAGQRTLIVSLRDRGIYRLTLSESMLKNIGRSQ
ncbi:MAG TPA: hypothetical protein VLT13_16510 [Bacteroidota bacterium]|nr:hypothetical protein [Bacteroidota bacterium]